MYHLGKDHHGTIQNLSGHFCRDIPDDNEYCYTTVVEEAYVNGIGNFYQLLLAVLFLFFVGAFVFFCSSSDSTSSINWVGVSCKCLEYNTKKQEYLFLVLMLRFRFWKNSTTRGSVNTLCDIDIIVRLLRSIL